MDLSKNIKKTHAFLFPIGIGHYRCPNIKWAILTKLMMSNMCLKPYFARENFDYMGFAKENLKNMSSLRHIPHLEDY